jgi:hypothetical protein
VGSCHPPAWVDRPCQSLVLTNRCKSMSVQGQSRRSDPRAFSSEVETGSRQENASNQESIRAPFPFNRNGKGSRPMTSGLPPRTDIQSEPKQKAPNDAEAFRFAGSPSSRTIICGVAARENPLRREALSGWTVSPAPPPMLMLPIERPIDEIAQGSRDPDAL